MSAPWDPPSPLDHPAVEVVPATRPDPPVVLTCEHASNALPAPWRWPDADLPLVGMHWAYDIGIAELTRRLARALGVPAVLTRFSRLLVDPNRPLGAPTLFRTVADGAPVHLNAHLTEAERQLRLDGFYRPYHRAVDAVVASAPGAVVVGMHSFTDLYEGQPREVQVGVLFERSPDLGEAWLTALSGRGYDVRANEPWSGLEGLMFAPQLHADRHGRQAVELELRQDLLVDPAHVERLLVALTDVVRQLHP